MVDTCNTDYGFYGMDAPIQMLTNLLEKMVANDDVGDVVLLNADFIAHHHTASSKDWSWQVDKKWAAGLKIMQDTFSAIRAALPDAALLPTIGTTDVRIKHLVPCKPKDQ